MYVSDWQPPEMQGQGAKAQDRASLRLQAIVETMRPVSSIKRAALRRWPGSRLGEAAGGVLLLAVILIAVCAYLLLLDSLGISPGAITELGVSKTWGSLLARLGLIGLSDA